MELNQLRCFIAVAETLHFGHAAQRLDMLPSALGRHIRLLEECLGTRLFIRSTRNVALTPDGQTLLGESRKLLADADALATRFRCQGRVNASILRMGAIDSAAIGLIPHLLHFFRQAYPEVNVQIHEDKTSRLLPRLKSGRLDLIFIRPPERRAPWLTTRFLLYENVVLAIAEHHELAGHQDVGIQDLAALPLIVPDRRARPHSHDLTMNLFSDAGLKPNVVQKADEKQTIINMVAAEVGGAIMPRWVSRMSVPNVRFIPIRRQDASSCKGLPLAAAWMSAGSDPVRDSMIAILERELPSIAQQF
ncbi:MULTISPECIES: LysR family transcriptional regulator [Dickeya]|uniref:LysR family transcriptional regulator n=1 Tax=Dickeya fangzhongdai TaxID=1778540 RepID=A0A2K8QS61_9GAMM|nr:MULTISPECIES: LysR family transcriptional regulator [Dickeya]ATZ96317.1 LysR family transcriptional regulator [Dickeya fangzhongdai]AYH49972.1 LysR family transcriptional regulator [Dickeya fangzhongdai]MBO8135132.1 LysR family transcriptional regulator [Dickeya fangzhongdai]QOH49761.1 LysR family transcriptional regulator [Dickeya fangzhongdai]QOH54065.1 LysR family transcriptional regulator [Dickeya fangzhongdai]